MDELLKDARFAHIAKDPKFRHIPKAERKVKIDKRFQGMFKDKKFTVTYTTDKRGRPVNQSTKENLRKYYDLPSSEEEEEEEENASEQDASTSTGRGTKDKKNAKNTKHKKVKSKKKVVEEPDPNSVKDSLDKISKNEQSDYNCVSRKKNLVKVKPKEECDQDSDDESDESLNSSKDDNVQEDLTEADLDENERQLHKRENNENTKLTSGVKKRLKDLSVNYARGEGVLLSDSSSEEESSETSDNEEEFDHNWGELDKDAETTDEITHRLAICNMNWDMIRAVDLMILLNSFLPKGGLLRSVTIYPSEYGQQRIKEEEISGPVELKDNIDHDDENKDQEEGDGYHMEKLRQYQLNRLKYYYAVAEFDCAETANKVYTECDGIEYESTANRLDLRFIPNNMTFDQEPKDTCDAMPEPSKYQPRIFMTSALQQVKVDLTWDDVDPDRQEFLQKVNSGKLEDINESDLHKYLASGSEDDSDTEEKKDVDNEPDGNLDSKVKVDPIEKYKALLRSIEEEEENAKNKNDAELEVTWNTGAKEKVEKLVKEKKKSNEELTPFEQYLEKRKAKRKAKREEKKQKEEGKSDSEDSLPSDVDMNDKYFAEELKNGKSHKKKKDNEDNMSSDQEDDRRKAELELLLMDQDEDGKKHFNMKKIEENANMSKSKRKRLSKKRKNVQEEMKEDDFKVDVKDPRFTALFTSHHYNIDPADPHYKKTKGTEALVNEKLKRRANADAMNAEDNKQSKKPKTNEKLSSELQALVKSVKRKAQRITQPKDIV